MALSRADCTGSVACFHLLLLRGVVIVVVMVLTCGKVLVGLGTGGLSGDDGTFSTKLR